MAMPWERVEKSYQFEGPNGALSLADLFDGRSQLIVYHFMFGPVTFTAVSRAPLAKIYAYKKRMGWRFPWVSSYGSDFSFDYHVSFTTEQIAEGKAYYNYEVRPIDVSDEVGISVFYKNERREVFHTYSCYSRASTCSMVPTITSTLCPKAAMRTASNSRWSG